MGNDKIDGEGQVCAGQTLGVEGTSADRSVNVVTPTPTTPEITATTTTTTVSAPTSGEQFISGGTTNSAATTVPATARHIHAAAAAAATKWIPSAEVGTTSGSMTGRGDRKIWK